jgi:hypothetical protein
VLVIAMGMTSLAMIGSISVMADGFLKACTSTLRNIDHFVDCDNHGKYQHSGHRGRVFNVGGQNCWHSYVSFQLALKNDWLQMNGGW